MCELLVDVDVVIKLAAYDLLGDVEHPGCDTGCSNGSGVIATTRFVAAKRLRRKAADPAGAEARLTDFLNDAVQIEPTEEELRLAAKIESEAAAIGLQLDSGESQLCAIAIARVTPVVLTGDKRAIAAAESLLGTVAELTALAERIACLEQAMQLAVERIGPLAVRGRVLAEPGMDTAVNICFQFTNPTVGTDFEPTGLASYVNDVRTRAPTLLIPGDTLALPSVA